MSTGTGSPLIRLAVRRPVALTMIATAVFVFGLISLVRLPMDLMPELSYPSITVRTAYPGAAPEDVEDRISRRLEQSLSVVKGLRRVSSISRAETSDVVLEFRWGADMKSAVQDVREKIDQTFLPDEAEAPTILRYDPSLDPILQLGLVGPGDLESLRLVAEEVVERRLETVPGVAAVKVRGGLEEEIRVEVDEARIRSRGLTIEEIATRLQQENLDQASGLLREGAVTYLVRTRNELASIEEFERIPIRRDGESVVRLSDVARVVATHKDARVITRLDGRPAVKIEVYREAGANIVELADRVRRMVFGTEEQNQQLARRLRILEESSSAPDGDAGSETRTTEPSEAGSGSTKDGEKLRARDLARPDFVGAYLPSGAEIAVLSDQSR
ncbi:MAG: efflux RND transporter permease subunit, partial [Planctomycetes bacterium]|nr:efflux RND transporter permease subunit [Planctomycetota bacterium]